MTALRVVDGSTAIHPTLGLPAVPRELSYGKPIRLITLVLTLTLGAVTAGAILMPLTSSVFISGVVTTAGDRKAVQHSDGGLVASVLVNDGQEVAAGEPLVVLDGDRIRAALLDARRQYCALRFEAQRLAAAVNVSAPKIEDAGAADECLYVDLVDLERGSAAKRSETYQAHVATLQAAQESLRSELKELEGSRDTASAIVEIDATALRMAQTLERSGDSPRIHSMTAARQLLGSKSDLSNLDLRVLELRHRLSQDALEMSEFEKSYQNSLLIDLERSWKQLSEAQAKVHSLADQETRLTIRSPVAGRVLGLSLHASGTVVQPGAVIMEIVPGSSDLVVEGHVRPSQAATLATGQAVRVRATKPNGRPITLRAHLISISADRLMDRQDNTFFVVRAQIDKDQALPTGLLRPGLATDVIVATGRQTTLEAWFGSALFVLEGKG